MRALLITLPMVWAASQGVAQVDTRPEAPPVAAGIPAVTAIEADAVTVIFVERVGAYWSLGPTLKDVRAYLAAHGVAGRLYVRYLDDPTTASSGAVRTEVGVYTDGDHEPTAPFLRKQREAELVASLTVESRRLSLSKTCARMNTWIASHGYERLGPVTEIYVDPTAKTSDAGLVEIQMPIRLAPSLPSEPAPRGRPASHAPSLSAVEILFAGPADVELEGPPAPRPRDDGEWTPKIQGSGSTKAGEKEAIGGSGVWGKTAPPMEDPLVPVADLVAAGALDRVSQRLIPNSGVLLADEQLWLDQLVFRVRAVLNGIARIYPDEGEMAADLAEAVKLRYEQLASERKHDPLARAVVRVDPLNDPLAARKEAMIRDLDRLSFRVAVKAVTADEAFRQVLDVIKRTHTVVRTKHGDSG